MLSIGAVALLALSLPIPWWTAVVHPPAGETGRASLTLFSFKFSTSNFTCAVVLLFYSHGSCPLIGTGPRLDSLAFYLFWSLAFLFLSLILEAASSLSFLRPFAADQMKWTVTVSAIFSALSILLFLGALSGAQFSFIAGNAVFGSSLTRVEEGDLIVSWGLAPGFLLAVGSFVIQFIQAYLFRRGES